MMTTDFGKAIKENTDEYGVIHWENIQIPDLDVKDVKIDDVPPMTEGE